MEDWGIAFENEVYNYAAEVDNNDNNLWPALPDNSEPEQRIVEDNAAEQVPAEEPEPQAQKFFVTEFKIEPPKQPGTIFIQHLPGESEPKVAATNVIYGSNSSMYSERYSGLFQVLRSFYPSEGRLDSTNVRYAVLLTVAMEHLNNIVKARPSPPIEHDILKKFVVSEGALERLARVLPNILGMKITFRCAKIVNITMGTREASTVNAAQAVKIFSRWFVAISAYCGCAAAADIGYDAGRDLLLIRSRAELN